MNNEIYEKSKEDPTLIFSYIRRGKYDLAFELVNKNIVNINTLDSIGNDVVTRLLKAKQYELVMILMKKKNWDVNKQNDLGDTFGHILALDNSPMAIKEQPITAIVCTFGFISSLDFAIICINSWTLATLPLPAYEKEISIVFI